MMPWFIWKGKNSLADFGLWIGSLPNRKRAEERSEQIEIPGRAGVVTMLEGEDVYNAYSDEMTVIARNTLHIDKIVEWLRGSSDLILCTDTEKARPVSILCEVSFQRDGNDLQTAVIPLLCQPFRKQKNPETITVTGASATIYNPGDVASKPIVSITGSGDNTITIGGQAMAFSLGSSSVTIVVDCDANIITSGGAIWQGTFSGDFWKIPKGSVAVTQTGGDSLSISPEWRWL
jgi:phage-related protein